MSFNLHILVAPLNVTPSTVAKNIVQHSVLEMRLVQQWEMYSSPSDLSQYVRATWEETHKNTSDLKDFCYKSFLI